MFIRIKNQIINTQNVSLIESTEKDIVIYFLNKINGDIPSVAITPDDAEKTMAEIWGLLQSKPVKKSTELFVCQRWLESTPSSLVDYVSEKLNEAIYEVSEYGVLTFEESAEILTGFVRGHSKELFEQWLRRNKTGEQMPHEEEIEESQKTP